MLKLLSILLLVTFSLNNLKAEEIKIGAVLALTGPAQHFGKEAKNGMTLAVNEINQRGGVNGNLLKIIFEDSETNPTRAVQAFNKLTELDGVKIVIGDVWNHLTEPLVPLADRKKILLISPTVVEHSVQNKSPYFYTLGNKIELMQSATNLFLSKFNPNTKVALVIWNNTWGQGYKKHWQTAIKKNKLIEVATLEISDYGTTLNTEALKIKTKGAEVVLIPYLAERLSRRLAEISFNPVILTNYDIFETYFDKNTDKSFFEGLFYYDWKYAPEFLASYEKQFKERSYFKAGHSYDAVQVLVNALLLNFEDPQKAMGQVSIQGVCGSIDFTKGNFAGNFAKSSLFKIENQKILEIQ